MYAAAQPLTRDALFDLLDAEMRRGGGVLAVVSVDRVRELSIVLGYEAVDALLTAHGRRLRETLRPQDLMIPRQPGELLVLIRGVGHRGHALLAAQRLSRALAQPFESAGLMRSLDSRIGLSLFAADGTGAGDLLRRSDTALSQARLQGLPFHLYAVPAAEQSDQAWDVEGELDRALEEDELEVYFQPQVSLRTGRPRGAEALVRWNHPQRGLVSPGVFIPVAERTGRIRPISRFAINNALRLSRDWPQRKGPLGVSVNISTHDLEDPELAENLSSLLEFWGQAPGRLTLEVTESGIMQSPDTALDLLRTLRTRGVHIAIDDFGTGYSSMAYFRDLPADELKVDRSFVLPLLDSPRDRHIVSSICELSHGLGMRVVAEGVEEPDTARLLSDLGCDTGQGYLYGKPLPQDGFIAWLGSHGG